MYQTHYYSIGVDYHKNFSQVHILAPDGTAYWKGKISHDHLCEFQSLIERIGAPCRRLALEVTMNWHVLYDYLEGTPFLEEIQLANPFKMSIISKTNNKNDKVDAKKIAEMLHMGYIPQAHAFSQESRKIKDVVHMRGQLVKSKTAYINRCHRLLGAAGIIPSEYLKQRAILGRSGRRFWLNQPELTGKHYPLLQSSFEIIDELKEQIAVMNKHLLVLMKETEDMRLLESIPGIGKILSALIASETDGITRFPTKSQYVSYCGLVPRNSASADKIYQGKIVYECNSQLKYAFIEAAWVAIANKGDEYFRMIYNTHRERNKSGSKSITVIAHRLAQIAWEVLTQKRKYERRPIEQFSAPLRRLPVGKE